MFVSLGGVFVGFGGVGPGFLVFARLVVDCGEMVVLGCFAVMLGGEQMMLGRLVLASCLGNQSPFVLKVGYNLPTLAGY